MTLDFSKIPELQGSILKNFLKPLNPNVSDNCLLNVLNSKIAQMMTFKRVKFKETDSQNPNILNYYALNFISSGGGKDKIVNEIDDYLLKNFKIWFEDKNRDYILEKTKKITQEAKELFNSESSNGFADRYAQRRNTNIGMEMC